MVTTNAPPAQPQSPDQGLLLALLTEVGAAKRFRSEAEHLYTAAAVGSFGAVSWGIAALQSVSFKDRFWTHPALVAAVGVVIVATAVIIKLISDQNTFAKIKNDEADIADLLSQLPGAQRIVPADMRRRKPGPRRWLSPSIVGAAALAATAFCLTIFMA
jgi:hypothetical protein